jgi:linoleoyl-CoA desaturase
MFFGQTISYFMGFLKKKLWKMKLPSITYYTLLDKVLMFTNIYCLYCGLFLPTIIYLISCNLFYHINIAPDHDTYESSVDNHYEGDDWLRLQVQNSGNFLNSSLWWTLVFGGINYQIEHHLFPNISHVHYPAVSIIVKKYCEENNIPYNSHKTLYSAYMSFLKSIKYTSI